MSSSPDSDIITISPPTSHNDLTDSLSNPPSNTSYEGQNAKEGVMLHIERAGALEVDIKPVIPSRQTPSKRPLREMPQHPSQKQVKDSEEDVRKKMEETVQNIKDKADRLQAAAQPYAEKTRSFAENQPVLFTFLVIFGFFSAIPLLCFGTFLLGATLFVLSVAAVGICVSLFFTIILATSILVPVLFVTFLLSTGCLTFLLSLFLAHRLYLHISAACAVDPPTSVDAANENGSGSQSGDANGDGAAQTAATREYEYTYERIACGISNWMHETKARVIPARYPVLAPIQLDETSEQDKRGKTVLVKGEDKNEGSEMTLVGEVTEVKVEQEEVQKGGKRVRWSVSEGSNGHAGAEKGSKDAISANSDA